MRTVLASGMWGSTKRHLRELSGVMEMFHICILLAITQLDFSIKMYKIVHLKPVYFTVCKFYFNLKNDTVFAISCESILLLNNRFKKVLWFPFVEIS